MICTKGADQSAKFRLSTAHVKFHLICTLIGSFCWKYIRFQLKKYRGVKSHDTEEWCKIWIKPDLLFQKWQEVGEFWPEHSKVSKICILIGPFRSKYIMFDLKKYRWVVFCDTEKSCKIWWKTDLRFRKWHEEFGKLSPEYSEVSKLGLWWDPFIQSRKYMRWKFAGELCVMTMNNEAKFEEKLTCQFKIDMRYLTNFDLSTWKSQKFAL